MFGIKSKIRDHSLYLLNDMIERQIKENREKLLKLSEEYSTERERLQAQTLYFEEEIEKFKKDIASQLKEEFQFSVEELYSMYGQFENKYVSIEFHKYSESAQKFGRNISGSLIYLRSERDSLEKVINEKEVSRTNGFVKISCSDQDKLPSSLVEELATKGFRSGDIYIVTSSDFNTRRAYNEQGTKEIPNTIEVKFDPTGIEPYKAFLTFFCERINDDGTLTEHEWNQFCGYSMFYIPDSITELTIVTKGFDENGKVLPEVRLYELEAKEFNKKCNKEELSEFNLLLRERRKVRIEQIRNELKRSTNKTLEQFEEEYPDIYNSLNRSIVEFREESLLYHDTVKPVYWDYKSYLHIYLRHCNGLKIEGHFEQKTNFQYTPKDIKRILMLALDELKMPINKRLSEGKEFRIWGDKSFYFNGNYYSIHVEKDGRVAAFHPLENPDKDDN